ncbi:hypothetical protein GJAV_G00110060 [Gymnothorax javanicus]|nr:hypothetical protein GJAV_G00110060 [Gymnothorax javanicus]
MDQHPSARSCTSRGAAASCEVVLSEPSMNLHIHSTTGTRFELSLPLEETVEGLKRRLSQRLRVPKERLALLHKETPLISGKLQDFGIANGSKLTLVPTVEAGLMSQASRPEQSIMQALESLTETQVSDFLSGRSPLTLALRVGDHMMFVQLQLAAQQSGGQQLHHRHLIARGGGASAMTAGVSGGGARGHVRVPLHTHRVQVSPTATTASTSPPSCPSTPRCSPAVSPLPRPNASLLPNSPSTSQSTPPASPCHENPSRGPDPTSSSSSSSSRSRKPGAVIESFVSHAPGVFSGTFSGTLHPNCQDGSGRPRRDVGTILQILNDLLSATRHYQGIPASLAQLRCQTQCGPPSPPPFPSPPPSPAGTEDFSAKSTSGCPVSPLEQCQSLANGSLPTGEGLRQTENSATRCKVEQLQLMMKQKQQRRKERRDGHAPYPWPANRKAGRSARISDSSLSSDASSLDMDYEDSVWKPDVKADINSEFVVA